jgi:multidrug efflux pump subunit AcrB
MDLAAIAIKNRVVTLVLTVVLLAAGLSSYQKMSRLEDPEFTIKDALVMTTLRLRFSSSVSSTEWCPSRIVVSRR